MKNFATFFSKIALAGSALLATTAPAQSIDCSIFPFHVATQPDWTPTCYRLNDFQNDSIGTVRYADSINMMNHLWFEDCYYFGRPVPGDGSIALCLGRNVADSAMSQAITTPTGEMLVVEFTTAGTVDMVRVWTWDGAYKVTLDSASAHANASRLDDGYYHHITIGWTPTDPHSNDANAHRIVIKVDGAERINFRYDAPTLLFGGDSTVVAWYAGQAFTPGCKVQEICLLSDTCPSVMGPTIGCGTLSAPHSAGEIADYDNPTVVDPKSDAKIDFGIYPNPVAQGDIQVTVPFSCNYKLVNAAGMTLQTGQLKKGTTSLPMDELHSGTYCLVVANPSTHYLATKKFVVQR